MYLVLSTRKVFLFPKARGDGAKERERKSAQRKTETNKQTDQLSLVVLSF